MSAMISLDNGRSFYTPDELLRSCDVLDEIRTFYPQIVREMDDELREEIHTELAPCTDMDFLVAYLERAADDIVIG